MKMPTLFDTPPAQRHSPTSVAAACAIKPDANTLRAKVLACIQEYGDFGATDERIQEMLGMNGSTQRPRRRELQQAGLIRDSGRTRLTRSNRHAVVWVATEAA